jgi:hypothetical protein
MKKFILFPLLAVIFFSCDSDSESETETANSLTVEFLSNILVISEESSSQGFAIQLKVFGGIVNDPVTIEISPSSVIDEDLYFIQSPMILTIVAGDYSSGVNIAYNAYTIDDCIAESSENFVFTLENPSVDWLNIGTQNETTIIIEDDDVDASDFLTSRIYDRTSLIIETPVDLNNDGIYSYDLDLEVLCTTPIRFGLDNFFGTSYEECSASQECPFINFPRSYVENDANGNPIQVTQCLEAGCGSSKYEIIGNTINILNYNNEISRSGEFSENYSVLTIIYPNNYLFGGNTYLLQDGTVANYTGNATAIYELRE